MCSDRTVTDPADRALPAVGERVPLRRTGPAGLPPRPFDAPVTSTGRIRHRNGAPLTPTPNPASLAGAGRAPRGSRPVVVAVSTQDHVSEHATARTPRSASPTVTARFTVRAATPFVCSQRSGGCLRSSRHGRRRACVTGILAALHHQQPHPSHIGRFRRPLSQTTVNAAGPNGFGW